MAPERAADIQKRHLHEVSELLAAHFDGRREVDVLEGGCGSASRLQFPAGCRLTGIDISPKQLERNHQLHDRILGDLQTHEFQPESFDAIVCWDVLEHLSDPGAALDRFGRALRVGGLLVLGFPNRRSLKGWLTRALPHVAHIWVYRWMFGMRDAGKGDRGPFPTPMRRDMDRSQVLARMVESGFSVVTDVGYESPMMEHARSRFGIVGGRWRVAQRVLAALTRNRMEVSMTDCIIVLERTRREDRL